MNGFGILKGKNFLYKGKFKDGIKHGKGEYIFNSGARYIGRYENDKKNGYGIYVSK